MAHKAHTALDEMSGDGKFKRTDSTYRDIIAPGAKYPPANDRYHLYISAACPWANRCSAVLFLKGLDKVVGLSICHPTWQRTRPDDPEDGHTGWVFRNANDPPLSSLKGHGSFNCDGCIPDMLNCFKTVRDLYEASNDTNGKYTTPVLWCKRTKTIVNNESAEIIRMLNSAFNEWATNPTLDLYPNSLKQQIDDINSWVYPSINNGVYRSGFAKTQDAYLEAVTELFQALDRVEAILTNNRYLCGDTFTEADLRLFMTLIRFDEVYVVYFKTCKKTLREYPNINGYLKEVYQLPPIKRSILMNHIKTHYFTSHPGLNTFAIIPADSESRAQLDSPHGRDKLPGLPIPMPPRHKAAV
eukprot:TRINITY_DN67909_c4_g1_i1.p1 TRINITY_DN67909_c4_g1~~TRINITY_DN67909_c4_g1_i1.p1  ORF type:complete len:387 (-),score=17.69 TRINITY_DN67909_c4_g1_i1:485-1552(-)